VGEVLTPTQAAEYLQVPTETLRRWRTVGSGPAYFRAGRHVRYRQSALDRWAEQGERETSRATGRTA
jgi:excisionase family DNA binding protein